METKHPLWQGHTDNPLAKLKMETNELPKDVKRKIYRKIDITLDWNGSFQGDLTEAAEFGYRLGLQSCEEELESWERKVVSEMKDKERIFRQSEGRDKIRVEQLKAKDEVIAGLKLIGQKQESETVVDIEADGIVFCGKCGNPRN